MIFRPSPAPKPWLPFGVRSVGHYLLPPKTFQIPYFKHFVQIFWGISGRGRLFIDNRFEFLEPGTIGIYFPGMEHRLDNLDSSWEYRWLSMDGNQAVSLVEGFSLRPGVFEIKNPLNVQDHDKLIKTLKDVTPAGERQACYIAFKLLAEINITHHPDIQHNLLIQEAVKHIDASWKDPSFGIDQLSSALKIHRTTLSRKFHQSLGVSVLEYLTSIRVQAGLSLLKQTRLSVAEIAEHCGYSNQSYFARVIHSRTDMSPMEFRKS